MRILRVMAVFAFLVRTLKDNQLTEKWGAGSMSCGRYRKTSTIASYPSGTMVVWPAYCWISLIEADGALAALRYSPTAWLLYECFMSDCGSLLLRIGRIRKCSTCSVFSSGLLWSRQPSSSSSCHRYSHSSQFTNPDDSFMFEKRGRMVLIKLFLLF